MVSTSSEQSWLCCCHRPPIPPPQCWVSKVPFSSLTLSPHRTASSLVLPLPMGHYFQQSLSTARPQRAAHQAPSASLPTRWTAQAWQFASSIPERYRAQVLTSSHLMSPAPPTPAPLHRDILTDSILPRSQLSSYLPRSQGSQVLSLPLRQTSQSLPPFLSSHTGHLRL